MKRIFKYGTGDTVPEGAVYLHTVTQTSIENFRGDWIPCWFVWHYFLVDAE